MPAITYKTRLIFDCESDKQKIIQMLEAERFCWNECSKVKFNSVPHNSIVDLHAAFYNKFRESQRQTPAQIVIVTQRSVLAAFRSIKSSKHKISKPPVKKRLSIRLDKRCYSYKNNIFSLINLDKRVKAKPEIYPKLQELLNKYTFCDPALLEKNGDVWIDLTFKIPDSPPQNTLAVGVDLGILRYAATSEGNIYQDKQFNGRKRKLRHNKDKLKSVAAKGSKSAKRKLKKLRHKETNINKNFVHHLSSKIIKDTKADTIVLENLKSIKVKKHKYQNKNRISQVPMYMLRQFLTYKALLAKKTVIQVCPSYTSQMDHRTNKCDGERRGRRYYSKTGIIYDADINAAINIALRSKLPVSQTERLTYGQVIVNSPIVGNGCLQTAIHLEQ